MLQSYYETHGTSNFGSDFSKVKPIWTNSSKRKIQPEQKHKFWTKLILHFLYQIIERALWSISYLVFISFLQIWIKSKLAKFWNYKCLKLLRRTLFWKYMLVWKYNGLWVHHGLWVHLKDCTLKKYIYCN